jgi:hypothetical protein
MARKFVKTQVELDALEIEISKAQVILANLREQHDRESTLVAKLLVIIAPYKRLFPEFLARIFVECLGHGPMAIPPRDLILSPPWSLLSVCLDWHRIALAEPRLWNSLDITYRDIGASNRTTVDNFVHNILSRHDFPVSLKVTVNGGDSKQDIANIILPYSRRRNALSFRLPAQNLAVFLRNPPKPFPILDRLSLEFPPFEGSLETQPATIFSDAPHISGLILRTSPFMSRQPELKLQWTESQSIELSLSVPQTILILRQCTNLVKCRLNIH